jgi:hypothetical protein
MNFAMSIVLSRTDVPMHAFALSTNGTGADRQICDSFEDFLVRHCPSATTSFVRYSNCYRSVTGGVMQYALLAYGGQRTDSGPVDGVIADVLARPYVTGWARLHADGSATTVRHSEERTLLTDGPFIETKEFLAGVIVIEADNLDGALAIAQELQESRTSGAIEVRPILEALFHGA